MRIQLLTLPLLAVLTAASSWTHAMSSPGQTQGDPSRGISSIVPAAPTNLAASVVDTTVTFVWTAPVTGGSPSGYVVEASLTSDGPMIASVAVSGTTFSVPNVPPGTYFVRVRAMNADGSGGPSNQVMVSVGSVCAAPPNAPGNLTRAVSGDIVALNWTAPAAGCPVTGYVLRAGSAPGLTDLAPGVSVGPVTGLMVSAPPGTYYVTVVAMNAFGASAPSNEVIVVVGGCTLPAAPIAFSASAVGGAAVFSWSPSSAGGAPTSYVLEIGSFSGGSNSAVLSPTGTGFTWPTAPGTYFTRVRAVNACGTGPASVEQTVTIGDGPGGCTPGVPGSPSSPNASVSGSSATISWNAVSNATSYRLDVGTAAGTSNILSEQITGTSRQLSGLSAGTYFMRVTPQNACGSGASSGEATFTIGGPPAPTVTSVAVTGTSPIQAGQSQQYTATATFSNGSTNNVTSASTWSSSNTGVANVSNTGLVSAVSPGAAEIRARYQDVTGTRPVQITAPEPPTAAFRVIPDLTINGTPNAGPGQCLVTMNPPNFSNLRLRCTLDASDSTPNPGITSYEWEIAGGGKFEGRVLTSDILRAPCGFPGPGAAGAIINVRVKLTVRTPTGSDFEEKDVPFIRPGAC